jgi:hypothetical protein
VTVCRPLLYGLHVAPLERGWRNPRKRYRRLPRAHAGQHRDIRPGKHDSSVIFGPVRPSLPLCFHPGHCSAIPDVVGTRDDKTPPRPLLCVRWPFVSRTLESACGRRPNGKLPHSHPRSRSWAGTGLATTHGGGEIRQDDYQLRGIVHHTTICSLELCGIVVNHLPLAFKRRRRSPGRGGTTDSCKLAGFSPSP